MVGQFILVLTNKRYKYIKKNPAATTFCKKNISQATTKLQYLLQVKNLEELGSWSLPGLQTNII